MFNLIGDICNALTGRNEHDIEADKYDDLVQRAEKEGLGGEVVHNWRVKVEHHRIESDIVNGIIKPVNKEYID